MDNSDLARLFSFVVEFLNAPNNAAISVLEDIGDYETYGLEEDQLLYQQSDESHGRPRISSVSNPLSALGFQYFSTFVRPLTLHDDDVTLYIDHVIFAMKQFDVALLL